MPKQIANLWIIARCEWRVFSPSIVTKDIWNLSSRFETCWSYFTKYKKDKLGQKMLLFILPGSFRKKSFGSFLTWSQRRLLFASIFDSSQSLAIEASSCTVIETVKLFIFNCIIFSRVQGAFHAYFYIITRYSGGFV